MGISRRDFLIGGSILGGAGSFLGMKDISSDAINALNISMNKHYIKNKLIPYELDGGCVIHLTDIHIGYGAKGGYDMPERLSNIFGDIVSNISKENIDRNKVIVCITGDIANKADTGHPSSLQDIKDSIHCFDVFPTKHRFFVPGNHDVDTFLEEITGMLGKLGYVDSSQGYIHQNLPINIVGTPDYTTQSKLITPQFIDKINNDICHELFTILMTHNPDGLPHILKYLTAQNLMSLSGHTHGLQAKLNIINPFTYLMQHIAQKELKLKHPGAPYITGKYEDPKLQRTFLNTNGIGDHTTALRTAPHEISIIYLKKD